MTCLRIETLTASKIKTSKVLRDNIPVNNSFISSSIKFLISKNKNERVTRKTKICHHPAIPHTILFNSNTILKKFLTLNSVFDK